MSQGRHYRELWDGRWRVYWLHPTKGWRSEVVPDYAVPRPHQIRSASDRTPIVRLPESYPLPRQRRR
jgi:hypothetical protein